VELTDVTRCMGSTKTTDAIRSVARLDPYVWVLIHRKLKGVALAYDVSRHLDAVKGRAPLNLLLRHRPFLIQPLTDQHPHKVYKKGRQTGVSELSLKDRKSVV